MEQKKPILSITMLASNRMDTLQRCLDSLTPIREAIPCELIITDTSKNPEVYALVEKYADKLTTFEWCQDFAKARNVGLQMAEGEWFMFIDDDEWFAEPEELIEFFRSGEYKQYGYANHRIKNFHDPEFKTYGYGWVTRLSKIWPNSAFHSKVHEYLAPYQGGCKTLYATSYHSGYIFQTEKDRQNHFDRNMPLLRKMEKEEPDNLRWKLQMLQEYTSISDWEGMANYGEKALKQIWGKTQKVDAVHFAAIHLGYAIALNECGRFHDVERVYKKATDVMKDTVLPKAYMELCMARSCWELAQYEMAKYHAEQYLSNYEVFLNEPKKYEGEISVIFLSDTFDDNRITRIYSILLSSELKMGNDEKLYELYPKLMWNKEFINGYCNVEIDILEVILRKKDYAMLERVLRDALSTVYIRPRMMKAILDWEEKNREKFIQMLEVIKRLDIQGWYKEYVSLLNASEITTKEEILEIGERFINLIPGIFIIPDEIAKVLERYELKPLDLHLYIDFKTWREALSERLEELQMEQVEELKKEFENSALVNDIRFYYFMMVYMEQKALVAEKEELSFDEMTELLTTYSDNACLCYEAMYGEHLQQAPVEEWPKKYQAARWLQVFYAEVGNDLRAALGCLAKVIAVYPRLADAMKYYLNRIEVEILNG